ncbi:hypothetical protein [Cystobacter fuscus]|uniref:hypothetical protein n=1 Tax=Cystobacter fuscus TaxID=43 RepID=UPI0037C00FB4
MLAERCFHALDHDRIEFHDTTGRCAVASTGVAAMGLGVCVLAAPEIVVGALIVAGVVMVGFAIKDALDTYAEKRGRPQVRPVPETESFIDQAHIQGQGAGTSGLKEMGEIMREFGRSRGASEVIIQGATRTTGARPGHTPRPIRVRVK